MPNNTDYSQDISPFINLNGYNPSQFLPTSTGTAGLPNGPQPGIPGQSTGSNGLFGTGIPGYLAGPGAQQLSDLTSGNFSVWDAIDPTGLLGGLFGGRHSSGPPAFQPYQQNGQVYTYPNDASHGYPNPIPVTNVPGATQTIQNTEGTQANQIRAMQDLLPYYLDAINKGNMQTAVGQLNIANATAGPYQQLMTQLYNTYGPQLNAISNEINRRNALSAAQTENQVLTGPGTDLVNNAYQLSQVYDKPYYDTRQAAADQIAKQLGSIDLSGGLTDTERNEIAQGQARIGQMRGTANAPSNTDTVANAMQYGAAGRARVVQNQSLLSQAINNASSFMPASKSGVDVFQVATGKPSMPNTGNSLFSQTGTGPTQDSASALGSSMISNMTGLQGQMNAAQMNQANIDANKKDWADYLNQTMSSLGGLAGGAMGALCWVAREVYGEDNISWLRFRSWLHEKAPNWFFKLYVKFGRQIAEFIKNKPTIKSVIKSWMDKKIATIYA